jgi:hypothetical protein
LTSIFNGYFQFIRSLKQIYIWLKIYGLIKKRQKIKFFRQTIRALVTAAIFALQSNFSAEKGCFLDQNP